jgi:hypothetical protein
VSYTHSEYLAWRPLKSASRENEAHFWRQAAKMRIFDKVSKTGVFGKSWGTPHGREKTRFFAFPIFPASRLFLGPIFRLYFSSRKSGAKVENYRKSKFRDMGSEIE